MITEADGEFGRADVARPYQNVFDAQIGEGGVIVQRGAAVVPDSVFAKYVGIEVELVLVERGGGGDNFEGRARLHHIADGAIFHLLRFRIGAAIEIECRPVGHGEDFAGLRPHQDDDRFLRRILAHGGVQFIFNNILQIKVDGQMHLITISRRALLAAIKHQLLAGAVMLDVAIAVLTAQVIVERTFHSLNAAMLEIGETDDMAQHHAVRINSGRVLFEINAA